MKKKEFNKICGFIVSLFLFVGLVHVNKVNVIAEDTTDYLCFIAEEAGSTVKLTKTGTPTEVNLETSSDKVTWIPYAIDAVITLTDVGDKVYFRNTSETTMGFSTVGNYYNFVMTGKIAASGDVTTLINKNGTLDLTPAGDACFSWLFNGCSSLASISENFLPATILSKKCYSYMFSNCYTLENAPELPAENLSEDCYSAMFVGCQSLKIPPELSSINLANGCYDYMFGLSGLVIPPNLPATVLPEYCYNEMFSGCNALKAIPDFSAEYLSDCCYQMMFYLCSNILISDVQDGTYTIPIRIPSSGSIIARGTNDLTSMFAGAGGPTSFTSTGTPIVNDGVITLYLKPCDVTITYDGNGNTEGSVPTSSTYTILDEATVKGNENLLTKTGKVFAGWSLRPDGKGKVYNPSDTFSIRGNMTLYARWEDPNYLFTSGSAQTYTKGTLENKLFTCDGPLTNLTSIKVDDNELTETTQYIKESGSTKITLLGSYLETLNLGSHSLKLTYSDGPMPTVTFNVVEPSNNNGGGNSNSGNNNSNAGGNDNSKYVVPNTGVK